MNCEPGITDILGKEGAQHVIDIITAVTGEQYSAYCAKVYKLLGMFLDINVKIVKCFSMCFSIIYSNIQVV